MDRILKSNGNRKQAGIALLISGKIDYRVKRIEELKRMKLQSRDESREKIILSLTSMHHTLEHPIS